MTTATRAQGALPGLRLLGRLARATEALCTRAHRDWLARRRCARDRRYLMELDDARLRDIGIRREDIPRILR